MIKLAALGLLTCIAAYANAGFLQGPMHVRPISAVRAETVPALSPSYSVDLPSAGAELVMPALHVHAAKTSKPRVWTCGPMAPLAGAAHGKANAAYGNVSRCEWK